MKFFKYLAVFLLLTTVNASAQQAGPFNAVQEMFAAMSAYDYDRMAAYGTDDYHLLENGEIWSMDDLINAARRAEGEFARRNFFSVIRQVENDGSVWISYWNRADLETGDGEKLSLTWLESAVVVHRQGEWKVEMLHSTRVREPKTIPEGVIMEEYVGANAFKIGG